MAAQPAGLPPEEGASISFDIAEGPLDLYKQRHTMGQDSDIVPIISDCFNALCLGSQSEAEAGKMLELFQDWQEHRASVRPAVKKLSFLSVLPLPPHLASTLSTSNQISQFIEFLAHELISSECQPAWLQHLTASEEPALEHQAYAGTADQSCVPAPDNAAKSVSVVPFMVTDSERPPTTSQTAAENILTQQHPQGGAAEQVTANLTPWSCSSQAPQSHLELPESSVIAPEAAAALESSSAAAADALHGILVQVAMARGEDTTSFVKTALKDPSVMQEALMHAQNSAMAQQMAQLESYSATSEQLFGTVSSPHPVTGLEPNEAPVATTPGAVTSQEPFHLKHTSVHSYA